MNRPAKVCIAPEDKAHLQRSKDFKHDGVTEKIHIVTCFNYEDCYQTVKENLSTYMKKDGPGVILLCFSCLLSRTAEQVVVDMDSSEGIVPRMIGNHGYANQVRIRACAKKGRYDHSQLAYLALLNHSSVKTNSLLSSLLSSCGS